jgi:YD repeat-containing protein
MKTMVIVCLIFVTMIVATACASYISGTASPNQSTISIPAGDKGPASTEFENDTNLYIWGCDEYVANGPSIEIHKQPQLSLSDVRSISAGYMHSLAVKSDGTVWAWGWNEYGQLGDGTTTDSQSPAQVKNMDGVESVVASFGSSLALKSDGTVWGWGSNMNGELACGTETPFYYAPVQAKGLAGVQKIVCGDNHTVALKSDGTVWAWGDNLNKAIGDGTETIQFRTPVQLIGLSGIQDIAACASHSLAAKADGTVWSWGTNSKGQLGNGTYADSNIPVQVSNLSNIQAVATGAYHSMALESDGSVWAWGSNSQRQLGNGSSTGSNIPIQIIEFSEGKAISGGLYHSVALKTDGTVWTWGDNGYGQLGNETPTYSDIPVQVIGLSKVKAISAGGVCSLAIGVMDPDLER